MGFSLNLAASYHLKKAHKGLDLVAFHGRVAIIRFQVIDTIRQRRVCIGINYRRVAR